MSELNTKNYREAISGTSEEGVLNYNWEDKPHRLVYDLCNEIEKLQRENRAAIEALSQAGIDTKEKCLCCCAGIVSMSRAARDKIKKLEKGVNK